MLDITFWTWYNRCRARGFNDLMIAEAYLKCYHSKQTTLKLETYRTTFMAVSEPLLMRISSCAMNRSMVI